MQAALDAGVLALIPASVAAAAVVFTARAGWLAPGTALVLLGACAAAVLGTAAVAAGRRLATEVVATRLDRASGLADRLASACAFEETLRRGFDGPTETRELMEAAIDDAVRAAPGPTSWPRRAFVAPDSRAAAAFVVAAAIVAGLVLPPVPVNPVLASIAPPAAPRGAGIAVRGVRLGDGGELQFGAPLLGRVPLWRRAAVLAAPAIGWTAGQVRARPVRGAGRMDAGPGAHRRTAVERDRVRGPARRPSVRESGGDRAPRRGRPGLHPRPAGRAAPDRRRQRRRGAQGAHSEIDDLLARAEKGELSREQLLDELARAHDEYTRGGDEQIAREVVANLQKAGKDLQKEQLTREVGEALAAGDLDRARQEIEKLAEKLEKGELSEKERQKAGEALERAAAAQDRRQAEREASADKQVEQARKDVAKAEDKLAGAKTEADQAQAKRQLEDRQAQLAKSEQARDRQQQAEEKRTLKRLSRNMKQASEQMRDPDADKRRQASSTMEDMARRDRQDRRRPPPGHEQEEGGLAAGRPQGGDAAREERRIARPRGPVRAQQAQRRLRPARPGAAGQPRGVEAG